MIAAANIHWGDAPTWLAAAGTVGALAFTYRLLRSQNALQRLAEDDRREREAAALSAHPRNVTAWISSDAATGRGQPGRYGLKLELRNRGEEPVYGLVVQLLSGPTADAQPVYWTSRLAPPDGVLTHDVSMQVDGTGVGEIPVTIGFTDCNGVHWRRESNGRLVQLAEPWKPLEN